MTHGSRGEKCHMLTCMKFPAIPLLAALLLAAPAAFAAPKVVEKAPRSTAKPAQKPAKPVQKPSPPVTVDSLLAGSQAAAAKGDTQLALRLAQSAIVADPARPGSYVALGDLYARAGAQEYARSFYQAALGIDPTDAGALSAIAALDQPRNATAANGNANKPGP